MDELQYLRKLAALMQRVIDAKDAQIKALDDLLLFHRPELFDKPRLHVVSKRKGGGGCAQ
jgi:hypothetical protein